ncbi:MAG: lipopolysaccharide heptosyltransferase II [Methylobacter sp.]|uniref:lipopolysaccharide heptosyltransferase II n=1 Tax=Methylobacter sp. TaxID=2051955 RepID=UPI002730CB90|nr:lipopolysaccharide heptosyltransferase II [Methylobacter sp.]MDP1664727.1 lipopolysaccharide heptosyltransferase II [Methylobacter sp.]
MTSVNTNAPNGTKKILVVGPSWVGDMVMAQSLFIALKNTHPNCRIDVLAPSWTLSLLERMPEVTKAIAMPLPRGKLGLMERIKLGLSLRSESYDQAILLPNSWKSALPPFFANIPVRTGYIGECRWGLLNDARKLDKSLLTMTVQRFVALGLPVDAALPPVCPKPALTISKDRQQAVIDKFKLTPSAAESAPDRLTAYTPSMAIKILALCPGAEYGPAKRWPIEYYAEVARHKIDQGWQVWLFGSDKDKADAAQINREASGFCTDFTGRTSLAEAVDLMSLANTVVSNDSGLMHVAAALDKKIIAIYGSSDPGFTPPLNDKARIISLNLDCAPCFKRECPLGHSHCLTGITPDQVLEYITVTQSGRK